MAPIKVTIDNFVRAETDRMFAAILKDTGAVNAWHHSREPTPIEHQPVIRQNRDTLYSAAIVDASAGLSIRIPDAGARYASVMVINEDHYVQSVLHGAGTHAVSATEVGTPYAVIAARILVDASDPEDVSTVNALQDQLAISAPSAKPFVLPSYDAATFDATRDALLVLARGLPGFDGAFGRHGEVDPVRHLIGSAAAWGGLPDQEARYVNVDPGLPSGEYRLNVRDVPVDGFWSISLYNAQGYFQQNAHEAYNINSVTAAKDADGSVTVRFGGSGDGVANWLPTMEGWNYLVRLYQPRAEILDGSWTFPSVETVS